MKLELTIPASLVKRVRVSEVKQFEVFLQHQIDRYVVGAMRYQKGASKKQRYMTLLGKEFSKYRRSGNIEQLLNVANYCFLESVAPENPKAHFSAAVRSVTREHSRNERNE